MPVVNGIYLKDFPTLGRSPLSTDLIPIAYSSDNVAYKATLAQLLALGSVGLTMPSAFSVANSPVQGTGTLAVTAAGVASQYIRGDGTLGDFPTNGGGGSSVSYYLNGSVSQGTIGGNAYKEMNKTPVVGTGTDFTIAANGYIAQFITDAGDPATLLIPGGNWNVEMYFSASSSGGSPSFYVELYKYDGTTFTLLGSSSATPEGITNGTAIDIYYTSLAVPETVLTLTDRLAIRVYVTPSGRTITLHTEDNHLSEIVTTFSNGLTALNGLTKQTQYFAVGTTGTDFAISSSVDTHTFNIPSASATARGLITTGTQTIAGAKTFNSDLVVNGITVGRGGGNLDYNTAVGKSALAATSTSLGNTAVGAISLTANTSGENNTAVGSFALSSNTTGTLNVAIGHYAGTSLITGTNNIFLGYNAGITQPSNESNRTWIGNTSTTSTWVGGNLLVGTTTNSTFALDVTGTARITGQLTLGSTITNGTYTYTLPSATGTLALTSALSGYLPLTGGSLTTSNTTQVLHILNNGTGYGLYIQAGGAYIQGDLFIQSHLGVQGDLTLQGSLKSLSYTYTLPSATGTLALTSQLHDAVTLSAIGSTANANGATLTGQVLNLQPASASFGGVVTTGTQTFAGNKKLTGQLTVENLSAIGYYDGVPVTPGQFGVYALTLGDGGAGFSLYATHAALFQSTVEASAFIPNGSTVPLQGMYSSAANTLNFATNTTNRLTVTSAGNVGIGTTSPNSYGNTTTTIASTTSSSVSALVIRNSDSTLRGHFYSDGANGYMVLGSATNSALTLVTNDTERMRVTSGGNVGIGTTSPTQPLEVRTGTDKILQILASGDLQIQSINDAKTANVPLNIVGSTLALKVGGTTALSIASTGAATFSSSGIANGTTKFTVAGAGLISSFGSAGSGTDNYIRFVGNTNSFDVGVNGTSWGIADAGVAYRFIVSQAGVVTIGALGSGTVTATSGVLSAVSDMNLKIEDGFIDNALEKVLNLKPRYFHWNEESGLPTDIRQLGFYAQEVNEALGEEAANTPKNANDKWGIYDRGIIAMLTKAIQELKAEIDLLKI